jgi:hypothetical protein
VTENEVAEVERRSVWALAFAGLLALMALPCMGFVLLDLTRSFFEWRGHHTLYMPGDPRRGLFDQVMVLEVGFFLFMIRARILLLLLSTIIVVPLLLRRRNRQAVGRIAAVSYLIVLAAIGLLMFHYHLNLWR